MILEQLSISNYKNISEVKLNFSPKLNCIIGANGMGKTNLLDSIYYLSHTRSHVFLPDHMLIKSGEEMSTIQGKYQMYDQSEVVFCCLRAGKNKVLRRNKKAYSKMSDHIGIFPLVMISPADMDLIRGGSLERRKFMDHLIALESSPYLTACISYQRYLDQRNALLKQAYSLDLKVLRLIDEQLADLAERIVRYRHKWLERTVPLFGEYYRYISMGSDDVRLRYAHSSEASEYNADHYLQLWAKSLDQDRAIGHTSVGPHKDDLEMLIDGQLIRKIGSQGQNKTYMISLKLAQFVLLGQLHPHNKPILLLDDVFDKLDEQRVGRIVELVSGDAFGQIFMTDTNRKYLDQILQSLETKSYSLFRAEQGQFAVIEEVEP